ncbi:SDR family NAD(P)-dependent oxidoreductase [Bradyrhizobium sp. STM 3809]|uniref:SDR family NAD(P)-dependent oxidoreductase n=1 Tax=Bradyrhizobium sp. STM 3809 TaxID=551936 RepID=UPI001478111D|nr:SDR family NAD(P)-dependent oxidoreductase [Bradyrhizobium sp. STM 3809]
MIGFGPGVGFGIARAFAKWGISSLMSRNPENLRSQIELLSKDASKVDPFSVDAGEPDSIAQFVQAAIGKSGNVDVLIYNVVALARGRPSTIQPATLTSELNINVSGALASVRAVLPDMLQRKSGTLLFSGGGWTVYPAMEFASISIGKAALRSLSLMLAEELRDSGVRAGMVTIIGAVEAGAPFDPQKIGRSFDDLYRQPTDQFPAEIYFRGT